jgi:hypothetical protein
MGIGKTTNNTAKAMRSGQMAQDTRAATSLEKKMAEATFCGLIGLRIMEILWITIFMGRAYTNGPTAESTMVTGSTTRCTELALLLGLMGGSTRANTLMTRNREEEYSFGQTTENTTETG